MNKHIKCVFRPLTCSNVSLLSMLIFISSSLIEATKCLQSSSCSMVEQNEGNLIMIHLSEPFKIIVNTGMVVVFLYFQNQFIVTRNQGGCLKTVLKGTYVLNDTDVQHLPSIQYCEWSNILLKTNHLSNCFLF